MRETDFKYTLAVRIVRAEGTFFNVVKPWTDWKPCTRRACVPIYTYTLRSPWLSDCGTQESRPRNSKTTTIQNYIILCCLQYFIDWKVFFFFFCFLQKPRRRKAQNFLCVYVYNCCMRVVTLEEQHYLSKFYQFYGRAELLDSVQS